MDVGLVEGFLVREGLLDVGGEGWRKVEVVVEVGRREDGREVDPRRRDGEVRPRYQVGEVVTHVKEDWMGVVVGWELEFVQKTRGELRVEVERAGGSDSQRFRRRCRSRSPS